MMFWASFYPVFRVAVGATAYGATHIKPLTGLFLQTPSPLGEGWGEVKKGIVLYATTKYRISLVYPSVDVAEQYSAGEFFKSFVNPSVDTTKVYFALMASLFPDVKEA